MSFKLLLYFKALRPVDSAVCILISLVTTIGASFLFNIPASLDIYIEVFVIITVSCFYAFASNNFFDKEIDRQSQIKDKRNPFSRDLLLKREMLLLVVFLLSLLLFLTYIWFPSLLFFVLLVVFNVTLYSKYLKFFPIIDLVSHFISVFYLFLFPAFVFNLPPDITFIAFIFCFAVSNLGELSNQLRDFEFDKESKIKTTAVFFGKSITKIICYASVLLVLVSIVWISVILNRFFPLVFAPLLLINVLRTRNNFLRDSYEKVSIICILLALVVAGSLYFIGF